MHRRPEKFTEDQEKEANKLLLCALETQAIPTSFLSNFYFKQYLDYLMDAASVKFAHPTESKIYSKSRNMVSWLFN